MWALLFGRVALRRRACCHAFVSPLRIHPIA
jgi:hypothetical protein